MKLNIQDDIIYEHSLKNDKPKGGTELMIDKLYHYVDDNLLSKVNIIIDPSKEENSEPNKKSIIWFHDLPNDPKYNLLKNKKYCDNIDAYIFVSHWQLRAFLSFPEYHIPDNKCYVIKNAIEPIDFDWERDKKNEKNEKIQLVYTSTPHRGLNLLTAAADLLSKKREDFEVNVFSSFKIYGWTKAQEKYQSYFDEIAQRPYINYFGTTNNYEVRNKLRSCHIFSYPCTWIETYCLSMVEAMSAGCLCVCPNTGSLPEIGSHFPLIYQYIDDNNEHLTRFANILDRVIDRYKSDKNIINMLDFQSKHTNMYHSWNHRKNEWNIFLEEL